MSDLQKALEKLDLISNGVDTKLTSWEATLIQKSYKNRGLAVVLAKERIVELEGKLTADN